MAITISGENNNDKILAQDGVIDQISGINIVGLITASHINVGSNIQLGNAGIITATTFVGNLTGNVNSTSPLLLQTGGSERFRITGNNELGIAGANYGSAGHVLTSGGSGSAVTWSAIPTQVTISNNADNRVITGGSGVNLNGEANLTFNGTTLSLGASATSILKISNVPSGYTSGALKINTDFAHYGHIQVRDKNQYQTAALNVENENDGANETCYIYRAVDLNSSDWANARMGAKSHSFQTSSDTLGANRRLLVDTDGIRVDGRVVSTTQVSGIRVNTDILNYGVVSARDGSNSDQSNHIACFQAENAGTGTNETNIVTRSVNRNSTEWANAKYAAKSHIWTTGGSVDANIRATINNSGMNVIGNFGINETSPGTYLHVKGTGEMLRLETTASGGGQCYIDFDDETTTRASIGMRGSSSDTFAMSALNGTLRFDTQNKTHAMNIATDGKVGVNEINPDSLLHLTTNDSSAYSTSETNTVNATNTLLRLENTNGSDGSGVNNYVGIYFRVGSGANSDAQLQYVRTGDNKGAFHFKARNAGSSYPNLMTIKSDGVVSFDAGTTAAITPSQTTASSIGHQTMSGGSSWFNHNNGTDYFGVDGDWKLTNGATYGKIVARNTQNAISSAEQAGHTWFFVMKTVAGTLGNSDWVVEPVAGWKMAWPHSLAGGATATFYMRDAVESFGSPTIPASGDYYIGWFYSVSQDMGTNGGAYYVDNTSGGKIYYYSSEGDLSNPHQRIPRQGDSWDASMTAEHIHFRFETLPKADLTGTVFASPLLVDPVMQGVPLIDGLPMAGGQLVKDVQWATNVSSVEFQNADFVNCNYLVTYAINGGDGNNSSTGWYQTRLQFCDHDGVYKTGTNDYISHCEWVQSTSSSPSINSSYAGYQRSIWLTGNGSNYDHEGYVWIIPSNFRHNRNQTISQRWANGTEYTSQTHPRIFVRGHSFLSAGNEGNHYREEGGGTYRGSNDLFTLSGFRLYGSNSSDYHTPASNGSSNGYVRIWRFKSGFEAREVS